MGKAPPAGIAIAGAGIAGLTAALAFARKGFRVTLFEREARLDEAGAGIQLSPNATRLLERLGVIEALGASAVKPEAVALIRAHDMRTLSRLPLGDAAGKRWHAPYLVTHRADLQRALLERVAGEPGITLFGGHAIDGFAFEEKCVHAYAGGQSAGAGYLLLVGADGVWSNLRSRLSRQAKPVFSGYVAWRAVVAAPADDALADDAVTALLDPGFHMVAYPVKGGAALNLVAVTKGHALAEGWSHDVDTRPLAKALEWADPTLAAIGREANWKAWPIFTAEMDGAWTHPGGVALIGDAAHAMTPFAAQGAAMAIEDAAALAALVAKTPNDVGAALVAYETLRRDRVMRVARRGAFNRFVWHAGGPLAFGRDLVLKARPRASLMRDFDWLYGYDVEREILSGGSG